jgi:hypothetical protein
VPARRIACCCLVAHAAAIAAAAAPPPEREVGEPLRRAAEYLWRAQSPDGGWHSGRYAVLREGKALTPFVLYALLQVPDEIADRPALEVEAALSYIRQSVGENGAIGLDDPDLLEYPNYSTAYAIRCLLFAGNPADRPLIRRMAEYLASTQYGEAHGFEPSHVAYGGWGFAAPRVPGVADHMDLGHTRCVLQALVEADAALDEFALDERVLPRAELFLRLLQRAPEESRPHPLPADWLGTAEAWHAGGGRSFDGGFYFSPVVLAANKAGFADDPPHWQSYATATCDGLLSLLSLGADGDDPRTRSAMAWLATHPDLDYPQGVPRDDPQRWGESIRFYHYAARAAVLQRLPVEDRASRASRRKLAELVAKRQRPDGSFVNAAGHLMKEDDPLVCTALAVLALSHAKCGVAD